VLGSTFEGLRDKEGLSWPSSRYEDNHANIEKQTKRFPELEDQIQEWLGDWIGVRATTPDLLLVFGGVPDYNLFTDVRRGKCNYNKNFDLSLVRYLLGIFVCSGLGARFFYFSRNLLCCTELDNWGTVPGPSRYC
tara:strand:+ start:570 stop:974 length:405 start_codon:yes stop_codon:yes gene_type:complete